MGSVVPLSVIERIKNGLFRQETLPVFEDESHDSQQLFPSDIVITLMFVTKLSGIKGGILLRKYCTNSIVRGIVVKDKGVKCQDVNANETEFGFLEGGLTLRSPVKASPFWLRRGMKKLSA